MAKVKIRRLRVASLNSKFHGVHQNQALKYTLKCEPEHIRHFLDNEDVNFGLNLTKVPWDFCKNLLDWNDLTTVYPVMVDFPF